MCIRDSLNSTAKKLENLQGTYETYLDQDIQKVNDILKNIQDLNTSIRDADIRGDDALELRDSRNMLLDELSQYIDIDVKYTMEDLGAGFMVEKLTVTLGTGNQNTLIDGEYAAKIGRFPKDDNYNIQLYALRDADGQKKDNNDTDPVKLGDNDLYGSLPLSYTHLDVYKRQRLSLCYKLQPRDQHPGSVRQGQLLGERPLGGDRAHGDQAGV